MGTYEQKKEKIQENKAKIKKLVIDMLEQSKEAAIKNIDKVLDGGGVDSFKWDENINPMLLPKAIVIALLKSEAEQYSAKGTSFEKQIKKDANNLKHYI